MPRFTDAGGARFGHEADACCCSCSAAAGATASAAAAAAAPAAAAADAAAATADAAVDHGACAACTGKDPGERSSGLFPSAGDGAAAVCTVPCAGTGLHRVHRHATRDQQVLTCARHVNIQKRKRSGSRYKNSGEAHPRAPGAAASTGAAAAAGGPS
jgi:hypothetical protein